MNTKILTDKFSEPFKGETAAKVNIHAGDGNLMIDRFNGSETVLASGFLQYTEKQGPPIRILDANNGQVSITVKGSQARQPWFHFPWSTCTGTTEWQIHLNSSVLSDITAHSDGGNIKLNLSGLSVARVSSDTGGGNMDVILPDNASNLSVAAKTGAGNVAVEIGKGITGSNFVNASSGAGNVDICIPSGIAARIHVTTGLGKAIVDTRFSKTENNTYQSSNFDKADNKVEIIVNSGAGNVSIKSK